MDQIIKAKRATQLIFLACGLGITSWAPMVPYAKDRLALDEAQLGLLLLFLGGGALVMMPIAGILVKKLGSRVVIGGATIIMVVTLPLLLLLTSPVFMAFTLLVFGAGVGAIDVAMNTHGLQVQNLYGKTIMSSLHGLFSIGGLFGSLGLGLLISLGVSPLGAIVSIAALLLLIVFSQYRNLFNVTIERESIKKFSLPDKSGTGKKGIQRLKGGVIFLGFLCFATFLSEGAMLDWSAVYLRDTKRIIPEFAGAGYAAFSIAMAIMRMLGDSIVERWSSKVVVVTGGLLAAAGILVAIFSIWMPMVLAGFILLGVGAANIVPVFFSDAGRLQDVSPTVSIPTITTLGYAGQLAGPAVLGFIAHHFSLGIAFGFSAVLLIVVALAYALKKIK